MEEDQEQKHCCRFCNKRFPCGRSLGGHMRSHMNKNSAAKDGKLQLGKGRIPCNEGGGDISSSSKKSSSYKGLEAGGSAGYGLRENPKKTWRIFDSEIGVSQSGKVCKECGKEFQSQKALYGHMRCHTERFSQSLVEEDSWSGDAGNQKQVLDSQSENEGTGLRSRRGRRSRRTRYGSSPRFSFMCASSSVSEIDQEQEDVAISLMMLSRDVGHWGTPNSVAPESSGNDSVVLEAMSWRRQKEIAGKDGEFFCSGDGMEKREKMVEEKEEFDASDTENDWFDRKGSEFGFSGSGCLRCKDKKGELDASDYGFVRDDEFKKPKNNGFDAKFKCEETGCVVSDVELEKDSYEKAEPDYSDIELGKNLLPRTQTDSDVAELGMDLSIESRFNQVNSKFSKHTLHNRVRENSYDAEIGRASPKKIRHGASDIGMGKEQYKKSRFECAACNKTFQSYQALGGHRASHKKVKGCFASRIESSETSFDTDCSPDPAFDENPKSCKIEDLIVRGGTSGARDEPKKTKVHECPNCFKVFASGQALGGHKRSHLVGSSNARADQTIVIQQQLPEIPDLLDLNLPAPVEEEINGHVGFSSWLVGSSHKHEQLAKLISS